MTRIVGTLSDLSLEGVLEAVTLEQRSVTVYGEVYPQPRLTQWYGPKRYAYSGIVWEPNQMPSIILDLKGRVEQMTEQQYNAVLLNYYRDGNDTVGWHSDDEKIFVSPMAVASLSLGATRTFKLRRKDDHQVKQSFDLHHGSILFMPPGVQEEWQHSIPRTSKKSGPRLNLTFRQVAC